MITRTLPWFLLIPVSVAAAASPAWAQSDPGNGRARAEISEPHNAFELGEITVYGRRSLPADRLSDSLDAVELGKFQRLDLGSALNDLPGVVQTRVGPRNESGVFVRGFDLRQVPLFIDGIPVYVPYDGNVDLGRFTMYDASKISVSKGYSSPILGPNALGGAINVVSRRPTDPFEVAGRAGLFSGRGRQAALNIGSNFEWGYAQLGASHLESDFFPLSHDFERTAEEDGNHRENSAERDQKLSMKVALTPNETDEYAIGFSQQEGRKGNPPYAGDDPTQTPRFWRWPEWDKKSVYYVSNTRIGSTGYVKPRVFFDKFDNSLRTFDDSTYRTQNRPSSFTSFYDDYSWGGSLEVGGDLGQRSTLRLATHYKLDHHDEQNVGQRHFDFEDETVSVALENTLRMGEHWSLVPGLSYERRKVNEAVDTNNGAPLGGDAFDALNPELAVLYALSSTDTIHLTAARKSRFPTIKDRYSYRMGMALPNPNLKPERALHFELGYRGALFAGALSVEASVFWSRLEDAIQRVDGVAVVPPANPGRPPTSLFQLQNVGKALHRGVDLSLGWRVSDRLSLRGIYGFLSRRNLENRDILPLDTPRNRFIGQVEWTPVPWLTLLPSVQASGFRYSRSNGVHAASFVSADFKAVMRMPNDLRLELGVANLFDRDYELTEGFPEAGRVFFADVAYRY